MSEQTSLPLLPERSSLLPDTTPEQREHQSRAVAEENNHRLRDFQDQRSTPIGGVETIAKVFGGELLTLVSAASGATDIRVAHRLQRIPTAVVWYDSGVPTEILAGRPEGGLGASGGNVAAWTDREVFVRTNAGSAGRAFRFVVT